MNKQYKFLALGGVLFVVALFTFGSVEGVGMLPTLYDLQHNVHKAIEGPQANTAVPVNLNGGCDQSATTTPCAKIQANRPAANPSSYMSQATSYTEVASTNQSGKIDAHLSVDNALKGAQFCDKAYKSRQIVIDGVDIVQKIATLTTADAASKDAQSKTLGAGICDGMPSNMSYTKGILEVSDVKHFVSTNAAKLPEDNYSLTIGVQAFDVNVVTGDIYLIGGYDGTPILIGKFK